MKLKITLVVLGSLAWANALSAVYATGFWAKIYDGLVNRFDLTHAEGALMTPVILTTFCVLTGIASVLFLVKNVKSKSLFSASSENLAGFFCLSAFLFYTALSIHSAPTFVQLASNVQIEKARSGAYQTGRVLDGRYVNDSYGFNFQMPAGWSKASWSTVERKKVRATYSLWGKSISPTDLIPKHVDGIDTLAAILKYLPENGGYNPSLVINANDKQLMLEKYGVSNLVSFAEMLTKVSPPFAVDQPPISTTLAGRKAISLKIISVRSGSMISQKIFAFEADNSYLEFVASSIDDGDASNLLACVDTIKFTK